MFGSNVDADGLVLPHQGISSCSADQLTEYFQKPTEIK